MEPCHTQIFMVTFKQVTIAFMFNYSIFPWVNGHFGYRLIEVWLYYIIVQDVYAHHPFHNILTTLSVICYRPTYQHQVLFFFISVIPVKIKSWIESCKIVCMLTTAPWNYYRKISGFLSVTLLAWSCNYFRCTYCFCVSFRLMNLYAWMSPTYDHIAPRQLTNSAWSSRSHRQCQWRVVVKLFMSSETCRFSFAVKSTGSGLRNCGFLHPFSWRHWPSAMLTTLNGDRWHLSVGGHWSTCFVYGNWYIGTDSE